MTESQKRAVRLSEIRQRLNELLQADDLTDEQRTEMGTLSDEAGRVEVEYRAALRSEGQTEQRTETDTPDPETRERERLRGETRAAEFIAARMRGGFVTGEAAEYAAAVGVDDGAIPLALFGDPVGGPVPVETRAATPAPATDTGVNVQPIQPYVFSGGLATDLGVEMPTVESGVFSTATITTALQAQAKAKGDDAPDAAAALTPTSTGVKRVSASVQVTAEDLATVGPTNFESALREHLGMSLRDGQDTYLLTGDGQAPNPKGILVALGAAAARQDVETFDTYAAAQAAGVDGRWARSLRDVLILVGVRTFTNAASLFRGTDSTVSAAAYLDAQGAGFRGSDRFAAPDANVQQALLYRRGRPGLRTAVQPVWNRITIDDVYTLGKSAQRIVSMHVLTGDVIIAQPDAYSRIAFKVA